VPFRLLPLVVISALGTRVAGGEYLADALPQCSPPSFVVVDEASGVTAQVRRMGGEFGRRVEQTDADPVPSQVGAQGVGREVDPIEDVGEPCARSDSSLTRTWTSSSERPR
jgi:hypothetical protein